MDTTITVQDIANVVNLIDMATSRGAVKGDELLTVGQMRQKFVAFIQKVEEENAKTAAASENNGDVVDATAAEESAQ